MVKKSSEPEDLSHPRHFPALLGYDALEQEILGLVEKNRLPQSLLLTGTKGTGKASFAYRLARFLLGHTDAPKALNLFGEPEPTQGFSMANDDPVSRRISAESHPDLMVLEPEFDEKKKEYKGEISAEAARKVSEFLSLTPAESLWRVVIIDSIDELNRHAANAILKILEEPPARSVIILISHNPARLLPTIRSRCQVISAPKLDFSTFSTVLNGFNLAISAQEEKGLYSLCNHSPGIASNLFRIGGLKCYQDFVEILAQYPSIKPSNIQRFCDEWGKGDPARWRMLTHVVGTAFSRILKAAYATHEHAIFENEAALILRVSGQKSVDSWCGIWEKSIALCADTTHIHLDKKLVLFQIFQMMMDETQLAA